MNYIPSPLEAATVAPFIMLCVAATYFTIKEAFSSYES